MGKCISVDAEHRVLGVSAKVVQRPDDERIFPNNVRRFSIYLEGIEKEGTESDA